MHGVHTSVWNIQMCRMCKSMIKLKMCKVWHMQMHKVRKENVQKHTLQYTWFESKGWLSLLQNLKRSFDFESVCRSRETSETCRTVALQDWTPIYRNKLFFLWYEYGGLHFRATVHQVLVLMSLRFKVTLDVCFHDERGQWQFLQNFLEVLESLQPVYLLRRTDGLSMCCCSFFKEVFY